MSLSKVSLRRFIQHFSARGESALCFSATRSSAFRSSLLKFKDLVRAGLVLMLVLAAAVLGPCGAFAAVDNVDDTNYKKEVEGASVPVFIDFYATWCAPCKKVSPIVDELATEYSGKIKFVRVDVDKAPKTAEKFNAEQLPTLVVVSKKVSKGVSITGYHNKDDLKSFIESSLKKVQ